MLPAAVGCAHVRSARFGSLGRITLNRPQQINALTLEMIRQVNAVLDTWEHDGDVGTVFIDVCGSRPG